MKDGPLLGVLGGMGPLATANFLAMLVKLKAATRDQDHGRLIVYSNPRIPDRSAAIFDAGASPLPGLLEGIAVLERCGADVIAVPCNSAHYWLPDLEDATAIPVLSIVDAVVAELLRHGLAHKRVGVLGTAGMIKSGIYQAGLAVRGYEAVIPRDDDIAGLVEPAIRSIKAGDLEAAKAPLSAAVAALEEHDIGAVVLGCTELPLALTKPFSVRGTTFVDSTRSLAAACLAWLAAHDAAAGPMR